MRFGEACGIYRSDGWSKLFPDRAGAASRWSAPRLGGPPRELMMTSLSRLLSFPELFQNARALVKRFFRHRGIPRSDVSSHLFTPGPLSRFRSGRCQGIGHAGKNMPCPSSAMSSGRLFLDRVARQHCPSPLHRHPQITMHLFPAEGKGDISTLQRRGHFYFALTLPRGRWRAGPTCGIICKSLAHTRGLGCPPLGLSPIASLAFFGLRKEDSDESHIRLH